MGIYRKYDEDFETETAVLIDKSLNINTEIAKLEFIINGITNSWKDRTTSQFVENTNEKIETIKKHEQDGMLEITNVLSQIDSLLEKYKAAS